MVRAHRTSVIIGASTAAGIILLMIFLPMFTFVNIDIEGLRDNYHINEEIKFSATISGFGKSCANIQASVIGITKPDFAYSLYYETPMCAAGDVNWFFMNKIPRDEDQFAFNLNQTGTYKVMIIYKRLPDLVTSSSEKEFIIMQ